MRETVGQFRARTGAAYRPAAAGRALADDEACPTLFRWPGAGALLEALTTELRRLGPPGAETLWLCEDARAVAPGGAGRFGALCVLEPLALGAAPARPGVWAAANLDTTAVWIPPRLIAAGAAPWDRAATPADAEAILGPGWLDERAAAVEALGAYLEELAALRRAGAPPPPRPWCEMTAEERAALRAAYGI